MSAIATRIDVEATEKNIGQLQGQVNALRKEIRQAVRAIKCEAGTMPDDLFWYLVAELGRTIAYKKDNHEQGAKAFIHNLIYGHVRFKGVDEPEENSATLALQFVNTYEEKVNSLYKPLHDVIDGLGDDGYGDVIDSFPLFGRERYKMALKGQIEGDSQAQYQGENYMRMNMENAVMDKYASACQLEYAPESECEPY